MRYLLALTLFILPATAQAQSIVISGQRSSIVVSGKQPAAAVITGEDSDKAVHPVVPERRKFPVQVGDEIVWLIETDNPGRFTWTNPPKEEPKPVIAEKPKPSPVKTVERIRMQWNVNGSWSPTESQTRKHLESGHGVNTAGLTHQQMLNLHDSLHNGKSVSSSQVTIRAVRPATKLYPLGMQPSSNCPGGVCPLPQRVRHNYR